MSEFSIHRVAHVTKNSTFKDIAQIGGREVNPISKKITEMIFDKSSKGRGSQNILSKIETLFFV